VAKTFEVMYQAGAAGSGRAVHVDVFKPDKTLDAGQSGAAEEVGGTGRYHKSFVADGPGWFVEISDNHGGSGTKHFGKPEWDGHGIADVVADVAVAVAAVNDAIGALQVAVTGVDSGLAAVAGDVTSINVGVTAIQATLALLENKIDALESPPMIG
jgi:hypothetical protein